MSGIRILYHYRALPDAIDAVIGEWSARAHICRMEDGCLQYELFRSLRDSGELVMLEWWASQEHYDRHAGLEATRPQPAPGLSQDINVELYSQQSYRFTDDGQWVHDDREIEQCS